jgi:hypothetical protein
MFLQLACPRFLVRSESQVGHMILLLLGSPFAEQVARFGGDLGQSHCDSYGDWRPMRLAMLSRFG